MSAIPVVELEGLSRAEWLEERRKGIGSSDVAAICGLDRFGSPLSVWLDKRGESEDREQTDRMRWGQRLEGAVADEFSDVTGLVTMKPPAMYRAAQHPFMLLNPDRFVGEIGSANVLGPLELKTTSVAELWETGPPKSVVLQLTHQMIGLERDRGWIAVLINGREFHHWQVNLEPAVAETLVEIETDFWHLVESGTPPPADGHPATTDALARLYRDVEPDRVVDLTDCAELLRDVATARRATTAAKDRQAELENKVKEQLGSAQVGKFEGVEYVTWKASSAFDLDRFRDEQPDLYAQFRKDGVDLDRLKSERPDLNREYRREHGGPRKFLFKGGK